jgi:protein-S-isoprenylcysteine O-methyltransferase Ste14
LTPNRDTPGVIAPPPVIFGAGLGFGFLFHSWIPFNLLPPGLRRPLAIALGILGISCLVALIQFWRAGTSPEPWRPATRLVTGGIYRISRNPMYVGMTLLYLAASCWWNSAWPVVLLPAVIMVMHLGVIRREEAYLRGKFGQAYADYANRVRRWF